MLHNVRDPNNNEPNFKFWICVCFQATHRNVCNDSSSCGLGVINSSCKLSEPHGVPAIQLPCTTLLHFETNNVEQLWRETVYSSKQIVPTHLKAGWVWEVCNTVFLVLLSRTDTRNTLHWVSTSKTSLSSEIELWRVRFIIVRIPYL